MLSVHMFVVVLILLRATDAGNVALRIDAVDYGGTGAANANRGAAAANYWGCQNTIARSLPYCNERLPIDDRLEDLLGRLTLSEKVACLSPQRALGSTCGDHTSNVSRVGLPQYFWLVETNTAVASECLSPGRCATQFPGPLSMAASFNRSSWQAKGDVFGTEQRALANLHRRRAIGDRNAYIGITAYGPNINQQRDPRFGRSSELPGEDPLIAGQYAVHMVRGMQEQDDHGRPKVLAYLKHFTMYSRETDRGRDDYNVSLYDLFDTYLPQYEMGMIEGGATGVMCSYNAINGHPSCANDFLLNQVMRRRWNRFDAHVTTDCGAVSMLQNRPALAPDPVTAAAWALSNGTDLEMGSTLWNDHLVEAVRRGLATEVNVNDAFRRSYRPHFVAGRFDDPNSSPWSRFGREDVRSPLHRRIQLEAALQGLVLLKNAGGLLPLTAGRTRVAVLGPLGQTRSGLMSDYSGDQICFGGGYRCVRTLAESIRLVNGDGDDDAFNHSLTTNASGVDVDSNRTDGIPEALSLAARADVVILCLGITKRQEREGLDRKDTALPGLQESFAQEVFSSGTPVVLVLVNGGQVAVDRLVERAAAVVEAFNPNEIGGTALAMSLFGKENRWGKLPYTLYPHSAMQAFDMEDHSMTAPPGRTYRYYTGKKAIFPFGYGLSMTTFAIDCHRLESDARLIFECRVLNTGSITGDEVVQVYHKPGDRIRQRARHPIPLKRLVEFARVRVRPGQMERIRFDLRRASGGEDNDDEAGILALVNENGDRVLYSGVHFLCFTNGVQKPIEFEVSLGHSEEVTGLRLTQER